jgi:hypothetical protein
MINIQDDHLHKKFILAKHNLSKRNWNGCKKIVFYDSKESINHLIFCLPLLFSYLETFQYKFNIPSPANATNMFENWLNRVDKSSKVHIRTGICALMWAICN